MKVPSRLVAPAVLVGALASGLSMSPPAAAHVEHHHAVASMTFTKWVISEPANPPSLAGVDMRGVVGGDVGSGRYAGRVLHDDLSVPGFWLALARYGFYGSRHSFVARVHVTENDSTSPATATLTGVVARGWHAGSRVSGTYTAMDPCPIPTPGNVFGSVCFQGTLDILR